MIEEWVEGLEPDQSEEEVEWVRSSKRECKPKEVDRDPSTEASSSQKIQAMVLKVMQQGPNQNILPSLFNQSKLCYSTQ